jgi:uncharacterized protein YjbI with pentapeptide repeats
MFSTPEKFNTLLNIAPVQSTFLENFGIENNEQTSSRRNNSSQPNNFVHCIFLKDMKFQGDTFVDATFDGAIFKEAATFTDAKFNKIVSFNSAQFIKYASFVTAKFNDEVSFNHATFLFIIKTALV